MAKKSELHYAEKDQIEGDLMPQEVKLKVTIYLDGDVLLEVRRRAKNEGKRYQTMINESLRDLFLNQKSRIDPQEFQQLIERVSVLEKALSRL